MAITMLTMFYIL